MQKPFTPETQRYAEISQRRHGVSKKSPPYREFAFEKWAGRARFRRERYGLEAMTVNAVYIDVRLQIGGVSPSRAEFLQIPTVKRLSGELGPDNLWCGIGLQNAVGEEEPGYHSVGRSGRNWLMQVFMKLIQNYHTMVYAICQ
ncbi:MAG TPA: hypothetical protein VLZ81_01490 [Blastocatellia bacterium]|nr:hypothetical protein [Blastocatellia bacterium]